LKKSPSEIRLEALKLAKDMLDVEYRDGKEISDLIIKSVEYRMGVDFELKDPHDLKTYLESLKPKMYTTEDVILKARDFLDWLNKDPLTDF